MIDSSPHVDEVNSASERVVPENCDWKSVATGLPTASAVTTQQPSLGIITKHVPQNQSAGFDEAGLLKSVLEHSTTTLQFIFHSIYTVTTIMSTKQVQPLDLLTSNPINNNVHSPTSTSRVTFHTTGSQRKRHKPESPTLHATQMIPLMASPGSSPGLAPIFNTPTIPSIPPTTVISVANREDLAVFNWLSDKYDASYYASQGVHLDFESFKKVHPWQVNDLINQNGHLPFFDVMRPKSDASQLQLFISTCSVDLKQQFRDCVNPEILADQQIISPQIILWVVVLIMIWSVPFVLIVLARYSYIDKDAFILFVSLCASIPFSSFIAGIANPCSKMRNKLPCCRRVHSSTVAYASARKCSRYRILFWLGIGNAAFMVFLFFLIPPKNNVHIRWSVTGHIRDSTFEFMVEPVEGIPELCSGDIDLLDPSPRPNQLSITAYPSGIRGLILHVPINTTMYTFPCAGVSCGELKPSLSCDPVQIRRSELTQDETMQVSSNTKTPSRATHHSSSSIAFPVVCIIVVSFVSRIVFIVFSNDENEPSSDI